MRVGYADRTAVRAYKFSQFKILRGPCKAHLLLTLIWKSFTIFYDRYDLFAAKIKIYARGARGQQIYNSANLRATNPGGRVADGPGGGSP